MFTGIIQLVGVVANVTSPNRERRFSFAGVLPGGAYQTGESIAVNGVCLTVENGDEKGFCAYASGETLARTNLGQLRPGSFVNLERALAVGERLGGHFVSGHIDCLARITDIAKSGESSRYRLSFPNQYADQVASKGSVALDGVSLTVNDCGPDFLSVNVIPESRVRANFAQWRIGAQINMETDILAKYVANYLNYQASAQNGGGKSRLNVETLARHGFI